MNIEEEVVGAKRVWSPRSSFLVQSPARSRCGSPCSTVDFDGGLINVAVKNSFLDFRETNSYGSDLKPELEDGFRRTRSLEGLKSIAFEREQAADDGWCYSPRGWFPLNRESWALDEAPKKFSRSDVHEDEFLAEVAACHGAAHRLGNERDKIKAAQSNRDKTRRGGSWPLRTKNIVSEDPDDVEFDLTIEEDDKPIKPGYETRRKEPRRDEPRRDGRRDWTSDDGQMCIASCRSDSDINRVVRRITDSNEYNEIGFGFHGAPRAYRSQIARVSSEPDMDNYGNYNPSSQSPKITHFAGIEYAHNRVPRKKNLRREFERPRETTTTIMIRNIPNRYRQNELVQEINMNDFEGTYDFVYLPMDKSTTSNVGYAFVNFIEEKYAFRAMEVFTNYRFSKYQNISRKIASVSVAHIQGFEANMKHYKQSAVNDGKVTDNRPLIIPQISDRVFDRSSLDIDEGDRLNGV